MYRDKHKLSLELPITQDFADRNLDAAPFASTQNIVNIKQGKLCLAGDSMPVAFVQKEKKTITTEIKIYKLIASNKLSEKKAILRPIFNDSKESSLLFPLMSGNSLDLQHYFLFEQFKEENIVAISWLMKQLFLLLEALHHLHTETFIFENRTFKGIIHGDIKPSNILISKLGNLVLADFDCAYLAAESAYQFGSLRYMAPELFANMSFTITPLLNVDKSDIWSLGITLYRLLNNKFPAFFNDFTSNQKNATSYFFQEEIDKNNYCALRDNISSFIDLKEWGEKYSTSLTAEKAKKSFKILQENKVKNVARLTQWDILNHLSMAMLASMEERPNAETILTLMQALHKHFSPCNDTQYQQFIAKLLNHSRLNRKTGVNNNLNPETESKNKKTLSFS